MSTRSRWHDLRGAGGERLSSWSRDGRRLRCNFLQPIIIAALVRDLRLATFDRLGWDFALAVLLALASLGAAMSIQQVLWCHPSPVQLLKLGYVGL